MTEERTLDAAATTPRTAGALLREARQAQGMHIAVLAAAIKVSQRKLEALEGDRLDELPDATFTRALAQTVCRSLKIDAAPVLALLPQSAGHRLEHVAEGINAPFRERPGRHEVRDWSRLATPAVWGPALLIVAALAVYLLPDGWLERLRGPGGAEPPQPTASAVIETVPAAAVTPVVSGPSPDTPASAASATVPMPASPSASAPAAAVVPSPATPAAPGTVAAAGAGAASAVAAAERAAPAASGAPGGTLQLRASEASWVSVTDASGRPVLSRQLSAGETVAVDGRAPFRLTIGNARGTAVSYQGRPVDLTAATRDNVARLDVK